MKPSSRTFAFDCRCRVRALGLTLASAASLLMAAWAAEPPGARTQPGIVYGQRAGKDLLMDVLSTDQPNGAAVVTIVSGDWVSPPRPLSAVVVAPFLKRGFTVFAIHHISQPEATVMDSVADVRRAIRFIHLHAADYGIDPSRIGVTGASSGGHLALMATVGEFAGDPMALDAVDRASRSVKATAVFFPVSDLVDMGPSQLNLHDGGPPAHFGDAFGIKDRDPLRWKPIALAMSPIHQLTRRPPPILIYHGTGDKTIPITQSVRFVDAVHAIDGEARLIRREGKGHGWIGMVFDLSEIAEWFDKQL